MISIQITSLIIGIILGSFFTYVIFLCMAMANLLKKRGNDNG